MFARPWESKVKPSNCDFLSWRLFPIEFRQMQGLIEVWTAYRDFRLPNQLPISPDLPLNVCKAQRTSSEFEVIRLAGNTLQGYLVPFWFRLFFFKWWCWPMTIEIKLGANLTTLQGTNKVVLPVTRCICVRLPVVWLYNFQYVLILIFRG